MSATRRLTPQALWIAIAIAVSLAGCSDPSAAPPSHPAKPKPMRLQTAMSPIDVTRIELGTAAGPDGRISHPATIFKPADTVYVAVTTERPGHDVQLKVKWTFEDNSVVKEITQTINPTDTLVTGFHVADGAGWPAGRYKLEVLVNDQADGKNHTMAVTEYRVAK